MTPRLLFILSSERSGSTLTRVLLGANSRVIAPAEMFLLRYPDFRTFHAQKPVAMESLVEFFRLVGDPKEVDEIVSTCRRMNTVEVYEWLLGFVPPDQLLVDKTPAYANEGETLRRSSPLEPLYIWLIRHPLGVIESHVRLKRREHETKSLRGLGRWIRGRTIETFERSIGGLSPLARQREIKWVVQQTVIRNFLDTIPAERQCKIRFEDLVSDPETQVRRLCDAIGVTVEPAMLEACRPRKSMNVHLGDPNFHTHDHIEADIAGKWRRFFSEHQLTSETRRLMQSIGVHH